MQEWDQAEAQYQALGAKVLGVSPDDVKSHGKFAAKYRLSFPLLADTETAVGLYRKLARNLPGSYLLEAADLDIMSDAEVEERLRARLGFAA